SLRQWTQTYTPLIPTRRSSDLLQSFEQREGVGGGPGKAADDAAVVKAAHLSRIGLHYLLAHRHLAIADDDDLVRRAGGKNGGSVDRKSTRLNSSHVKISYAVFC